MEHPITYVLIKIAIAFTSLLAVGGIFISVIAPFMMHFDKTFDEVDNKIDEDLKY